MQIKTTGYVAGVAAVVDDHKVCMPVLKATVEGAVTSASGRIFQSLYVCNTLNGPKDWCSDI